MTTLRLALLTGALLALAFLAILAFWPSAE